MGTQDVRIEEIRQLLSHLHGEITVLESNYSQVLRVLRRFEMAVDRDDLTGLLRRGALGELWKELYSDAKRSNEDVHLLLIDIDHFKLINDTHGHPTGDDVICAVARLLSQYESPQTLIARVGGEEFVVAVRGTSAEAMGLAEFIRRGAERLHGPVKLSEDSLTRRSHIEWKCTLSIGVAPAPRMDPEAALSAAMKAADAALYRAKTRGRNQVCAA